MGRKRIPDHPAAGTPEYYRWRRTRILPIEPVQPIRVAAGPANFAAADATLARAIQRSATTYKVPVIAMGPCMSALASGVERAFVREFVEGGSVDAASLESGLPCKTIDKPTVRAAIVEHARKRSLELAGMIAHYAEPVE